MKKTDPSEDERIAKMQTYLVLGALAIFIIMMIVAIATKSYHGA